MATRKAKEHPSGVDRWTSNGQGIKLSKPSAELKARVDAVNRELAAGSKKPAKKK